MSDHESRTRRDILRGSTALAAITLVPPISMLADDKPAAVVDTAPGILELRLKTRKLDDLRRFYPQTLGLPLVRDAVRSITVQAGSTAIVFDAVDENEPFYHFAFNIPENKLAAAKQWLKPRCPLIKRPNGLDEYDFASWNANAIYFLDPAGNILEFIARHDLKNASAGEFTEKDILYASEIALVVDDVAATIAAAERELQMKTFAHSASTEFAAVGTDQRLLIIVKRGRPWNAGLGKVADVFETGAVLRTERAGQISSPPHRYEVSGREFSHRGAEAHR
jgi:catechol 2,3-dioxygenase-like lactoylglutathione lyase family enzyme